MSRKYFYCLLLVAFSCSESERPDTILASDVLTFQKISDMIGQAELIWPGYNYLSTRGSYVILTEDDGSEPRGYFLNPSAEVANESTKITAAESAGLNLYRNDSYLKQSFSDAVLGETGLFKFYSLVIKGQSYFVIRSIPDDRISFYDAYKNADNNWLPLVMIHEVFHMYQIDEWTEPSDAVQDFFGYPLTEELILYELAIIDLMTEAHQITGETAAHSLLQKFIALYEKMISVDPTEEMIVRKMGSYQMFIEGSARYVEHYSAKNSIYPTINEDPTHGWRKFIYEMDESTVDLNLNIRRAFAFRIWYHTGSGVINLLKEAGVSIEDRMAAGVTPYELALEEVELTTEQKEAIVAEMVSAPGWSAYVQKANYLHGLLE
jgi:hypothetical protein